MDVAIDTAPVTRTYLQIKYRTPRPKPPQLENSHLWDTLVVVDARPVWNSLYTI